MAVNPLIALQARSGVNVAGSFNNALTNLAKSDAIQQGRAQAPIRNRLLEAQTSTVEAGVPSDTAQDNKGRLELARSLAIGARQTVPNLSAAFADLKSGNTEGASAKFQLVDQQLQQRGQEILARGGTIAETTQARELLQSDPQEYLRRAQDYIALDDQLNRKQGNQGLFSAKTEFLESGASIQADPSGNIIVKNAANQVVTGQDRLDVIEENRKQKEATLDRRAERTVSTAKKVENVKLRQQRISSIRKEQSTRKRESKRSMVRLNNAFKLAEKATQGITGAAKLQLARLFPGIDASDEGALAAGFKQLSLDQLQLFKGPTTDFEFRVTEDIAGSLGDSKSANKARIASLQRNNWFIGEETDQFNKWTRQGGDPDLFSFNFNEPVETKKGIFTLQDVQDTAVSNNISIEETLKRLNK